MSQKGQFPCSTEVFVQPKELLAIKKQQMTAKLQSAGIKLDIYYGPQSHNYLAAPNQHKRNHPVRLMIGMRYGLPLSYFTAQ